MNVRNKLLLVFLFLVVIFMTGIVYFQIFEKNRLHSLAKKEKDEQERVFNKIVTLKGQRLETFVYDYSFWDEMVNFIKTKDETWARENIDSAFNSFDTDVAWVYDIEFGRVYSASSSEDLKGFVDLPIPSYIARSLFMRSPFCHFFLKTPHGVLEIRGATIHPTADIERKTAPHGYFFSGRFWDKEYLDDLAGLLGNSVSIATDEGLVDGYRKQEAEGALFIEIPLPGWDGKPVSHLGLVFNSSVLEQYESLSKKNILILILITGFLFLAIIFYLNRFLISPLALFSKAFKQETPLYLEALKENKDEFGEISRLFINFLEQKKLLVQEVEARRFAESAFAKLNDAFLKLGLDFSSNAAILTSACGEILESYCAMYKNKSNGVWATVFGWNVPKNFIFENRTHKCVCYDIVQSFGESGQIYRIRLQKDQAEFSADAGLLGAGVVGRLCIFFKEEIHLNEMQGRIIEVCAKALSIEEERRRVHEMLRENQERWQFAIEGSEEGVWDWDIAANRILFSRRWKELLGYSAEEIKNELEEWYTRVHPEDIADLKESLDKHLKGDVPIFVSEYRMRCKDGSYRLFFDRGKIVKQSAEGRPLRLVGTHTDMTGRKS